MANEVKMTTIGDVNPLTQMRQGLDVKDIPRPLKKVAKIGNLYHEYVKDTSLQKKGASGTHMARELETLGLINVDWKSGLYAWKAEPLSKNDVLAIFVRDVKVKAAAGQ